MSSDDSALVERSVRLAARIQAEADAGRGRVERARQARVARLLDDPEGLAFTIALTDEVLRIRDPSRAARQLRSLVSGLGSPRFLGPLDRTLLRVGLAAAERLPELVMPLVAARLRSELAGYVLPAEPWRLRRYLERRRVEGTRVNLNLLGEAILGDAEADRRLEGVLGLLGRSDVDYVSVKVTSICAQVNPAAFDEEVERVAVRLRRLYDEALRARPAKFVNLDMEEHRDLGLTLAVFTTVLSEPAYRGLDAGIVLQAYLPDSLPALGELVDFARKRRAGGGGRVKVRIVKGANLAMERVEAELAGWEQAPFATKAEVDANYKRMLDVALDPANADALRVGAASHNLFELAWALSVAAERGLSRMLEIEMLEGMAGSAARPVRDAAGGLLLYAPIVARSDHESAIAYLVRRFDENTGPDNYLRNQFAMRVGSPAWEAERRRFEEAVAARHEVPPPTRRTQDRSAPTATRSVVAVPTASAGPSVAVPAPCATSGSAAPPDGFANEPDTDLTRPANRRWLAHYLSAQAWDAEQVVPAVVDGEAVAEPASGEGRDPSDPSGPGYRYVESPVELVERAVGAAVAGRSSWAGTPGEARAKVLQTVADVLADRRGELIAVMAADAGKVFAESDPEVSEAVDFARYYARSAIELDEAGGRFRPYGTVAVVPPWNFPLAIPAGGVLAALAAGNTVVLKPAPEAVAVGYALAQACWDAGVPHSALQFVPCADGEAGRRLVTHPEVGAVILTGSWDTARMFLGWRPGLRLHAETSGKNAIVVTAAADLDRAVADLVHSAFGHAGQKCSAASLAIVEASVYDDERFRHQLADAAATLRPGPAREPTTTIGPLVRPPAGPLRDALHHLGPGESWLLEPRPDRANPQLWSPGIKLGVAPGSPFHLTECFGPVLGLMRAADLDQAIVWQNQPAYGLTAGLQSLDPAEILRWLDRVQAGNLYVNRHITGAIVGRQPFGGWKRSAVGPGAKAGGRHYVASLGTWVGHFEGSPELFGEAVARELTTSLSPSDPSGLAAEANVARHLPLHCVLLRTGRDVSERDAALALAAGRALGVDVTWSSPLERPGAHVVETDEDFATRAGAGGWDKVRVLGEPDPELLASLYDRAAWLDLAGVVADPGREALRWVREQAVSLTLHRHGNSTGRYDGVVSALRSPARPGRG